MRSILVGLVGLAIAGCSGEKKAAPKPGPSLDARPVAPPDAAPVVTRPPQAEPSAEPDRATGKAGDPPLLRGKPDITQIADVGKTGAFAEMTGDDEALYVMLPFGLKIFRIPYATGTPELILDSKDADSPHRIRAANGTVYWLTGDGYASMPATGGPVTKMTSGSFLHDLAITGGAIFTCPDHTILRAPISGGPPVVLDPDTNDCLPLVTDGVHVAWMSDRPRPSQLMVATVDGGPPLELAAIPMNVGDVAVSGDAVYYILESSVIGHGDFPYPDHDAAIRSRPVGGGDAKDVLVRLTGPKWLLADSKYLYWGPDFARARLDGSDAHRLAIFPKGMRESYASDRPVLHDGALYWLDSTGQVFALKPPP